VWSGHHVQQQEQKDGAADAGEQQRVDRDRGNAVAQLGDALLVLDVTRQRLRQVGRMRPVNSS
jgi:hypothetical protein